MIEEKLYKSIQNLLPIVCVDCVIQHRGKILLLKRTHQPAKNQFWFPGGRIFKNETIVSASLRKSLEETNLHANFVKQLMAVESIFKQENEMEFGIHTVNVCCLLSVDSIQSFKLDSYHSDHIWIDSIKPDLHEAVQKPLYELGLTIQTA